MRINYGPIFFQVFYFVEVCRDLFAHSTFTLRPLYLNLIMVLILIGPPFINVHRKARADDNGSARVCFCVQNILFKP